MKKKGLMVKFLVTIILALIIFIPSCIFASNFLRVSSQAAQSFTDFKAEIYDVHEKGVVGEPAKLKLLILDQKTGIFYFSKPIMKVNVNSEGALNYEIMVQRPARCNNKNCLCLFKEVKLEASLDDKKAVIKDKVSKCEPLDFDIEYGSNNCGVGLPQQVNSYICDGGFFAERGILSSSSNIASYYKIGRRTSFNLEKTSSGIKIQAT